MGLDQKPWRNRVLYGNHNTQVAPENPKVWRALVDFLETGNDNNALAAALLKWVQVAEAKGNFGRSRSLRIRLSEVREAIGDKRGALSALKEFTANSVAVSAINVPPAASGAAHNKPAAGAKAAVLTAAQKAAIGAGEALRDSENMIMKDRSTRLFMDINASLVPDAAPTPAPTPVRQQNKPKVAATPPKPPPPTTVAAAAKVAAAAAATGPKLTTWVKAATTKSQPSAEAITAMSDAERMETLGQHCGVLEEAGEAVKRRRSAVAVALFIAASGAEAPWVHARLRELFGDGSTAMAREGALLATQALCEIGGATGEPYTVGLLPLVLRCNGDQSAVVRGAAAAAGAALARSINPHAVRLVLPAINEAIANSTWRIKAGALEVMATLAESSPVQVALALPEIVPVVSHQVCISASTGGVCMHIFHIFLSSYFGFSTLFRPVLSRAVVTVERN